MSKPRITISLVLIVGSPLRASVLGLNNKGLRLTSAPDWHTTCSRASIILINTPVLLYSLLLIRIK